MPTGEGWVPRGQHKARRQVDGQHWAAPGGLNTASLSRLYPHPQVETNARTQCLESVCRPALCTMAKARHHQMPTTQGTNRPQHIHAMMSRGSNRSKRLPDSASESSQTDGRCPDSRG